MDERSLVTVVREDEVIEARKTMTTKQAAEYVGHGTSPRTIVEWIHSGRLKADRAPSKRGAFFILKDDLDAAMKWNLDEAIGWPPNVE